MARPSAGPLAKRSYLLIIEVVEGEDKVKAIVPVLSEMVKGGLITIEEVQVLRHIG